MADRWAAAFDTPPDLVHRSTPLRCYSSADRLLRTTSSPSPPSTVTNFVILRPKLLQIQKSGMLSIFYRPARTRGRSRGTHRKINILSFSGSVIGGIKLYHLWL